MARTCGTCGRSWPTTATFCGGCGALLDPAIGARATDAALGSRWRRPAVGWTVAVLLVVGTVAALPTLTVERTPPVDGEIGVPDTGDLQAAPAGTRQRPRAPAPEVRCTAGGEELACVTWSRGLLPPEDPQHGLEVWPTVAGRHLLVSGDGAVEAIDPADGTRLWRTELDGALHVLDARGDDVLVTTADADVALLDLPSGQVRWTADNLPVLWGDLLLDDVAVTMDGGSTLVAHDLADGTPRWRWPSEWVEGVGLHALPDERVLVTSSAAEGMALLDTRTGEELARTDLASGWVLDVVDDVVVSVVAPARHRPGRAGDPGATLVAVDVADLSVRWEQPVPASEVSFTTAGRVVLAPSTGRMTAFDVATGATAWELEVPISTELAAHHRDGWSDDASPPVVVLHDQDDDVVRGHDPASGAPRWEHTADVDVHWVVAGVDHVLLHVRDAIVVLDAITGRERLRIETPSDSPLVSLDPAVLVHAASGHVVRLQLPDPSG